MLNKSKESLCFFGFFLWDEKIAHCFFLNYVYVIIQASKIII